MVSLLSENKFALLIARRNLTSNLKTTAVIIVTLSLLFAIFMMMLGIKGIYKDIFTKEAQSRYPNTDIIISYDEYSVARLINRRQIIENYENISFALPFFNLQVLTEHDGEVYYSSLLSALEHEFERLMDVDITLGTSKAIITESYAEKHGLSVGDKFGFYILDNFYEYEVNGVVKEQGIFKGESFFIDKQELLNKLYGFSFLNNFGNVIYISTGNIDETFELFKNDQNYLDYNIRLVVDEKRIDAIVNEYVSIILVAGIIVLLALVIVLNSLFLIVLKDIFIEIGVFETLGANKKLGYLVCTIQWLLYIIISFAIGIVIAHVVVNIGAYFYGISSLLIINPSIILLTLLMLGVVIVIKNYILLRKHYRKKTIDKIRDKRYVLAKFNGFFLVSLLVFCLVLVFFKPFSDQVNSLLLVGFSIYLSINILVLTLRFVLKFFAKKRSTFSIFNAKYMTNNRSLHQSLHVMFVALVVIGIMITVRLFIGSEIKLFTTVNHFDLLITNIHNYQDSIIDEVYTYDVESANPALFYRDTLITINDKENVLVRNFISIDMDDLNKYFTYTYDDVDEIYLNHQLPYILMPSSYQVVYGLNVGDIIKVDLTPDLRKKDFVLGGFIDTNFDQIVFSNLYERADVYGTEFNTIVINSNNPDRLITDLVRDFGPRMYFVSDARAQMQTQVDLSSNILALFTVITIFIILSFIFVVFNNTSLKFYSLKNDIAKVKVLGMGNKRVFVDLIYEAIVVTLVIFIIGFVQILILSNYLKYVLLFFEYYKELQATVTSIVLTYLIVLFSILISYVYYYIKVKSVSVSEEVRTI